MRRVKLMIANKVVALILCIVTIVFADGGASTEDVNPFNEFMQPSGGVNLFSGDASFPLPIYSLAGRNGMNVDIKFQYSSNIYAKVRARNDIAPTGIIGLGWAFGVGKVVSDHNNTGKYDDDTYFWESPEGLQKKLFLKADNSFYIEDMPYWKVERKISNGLVIGWEFTDKMGKKYYYGNPDGTYSSNNATRYTVYCKTTNYVGPNLSTCAEQYPYIWDLACVSDLYNNKIQYTYEQKTEKFDPAMDLYYTRASYISKIQNPQGDKIEFTYKEKEDRHEFYAYHSKYQKASRYLDTYEKEYLSDMVVTVQNNAHRKFTFGYKTISLIGDKKNAINPDLKDCYTKRLLTSMREYTNNFGNFTLLNTTGFSYNDDPKEIEKDENYNFGALKEILLPRCGKISYVYKKQNLTLSSKGKFSSDGNAEFKDIVNDAEYLAGGVTEDGIDFAVLSYAKTATNMKLVIVYWDGVEWRKQKITITTDDKFVKALTGNNYLVLITKKNNGGGNYNFGFKFCNYSPAKKEFIVKDEDLSNAYNIDAYVSEPKILISGDNILITNLIDDPNKFSYKGFERIGPSIYNTKTHEGYVYTKVFTYDRNKGDWRISFGLTDILSFGGFDSGLDRWKDREAYRYDYLIGKNYLLKCLFSGNKATSFTQIKKSGLSVTGSFEECSEKGTIFRYADKFKEFEVYTFNGSTWESKTYSLPDLVGERVFIGENYFIVYYKQGANERVYIYRWNGNDWNRESQEFVHAKNFEVTTGNDFFVINRPIDMKIDLFTWDGANWVKQLDREDFDKMIHLKTGNDFFVLRYAEHSSGSGKNWHLKEKFKVWNKFTDQFSLIYKDKIGLGNKIEKTFDVGNDFIVASRNKDQKRNAVHDLTFNSLIFNGIEWETEKIYSEFTKNKEEMKDPQPYAFGQSFFIKKNAGNTKELLFYKKFQNSFKEPIFVYSVVKKEVYDGMNAEPMEINYDYNVDGNCYYNLKAGTAEFENVKVSDGSGGATKYKFICGANVVDVGGIVTFNKRIREGQLEEKTILDKSGGVVSKEKYSYGILDKSTVTGWPSEMFYVYNSKIETEKFGVTQSVENTVDVENGEIEESKEIGGSKIRITKNIFPTDIMPIKIPEYEKMMEKNIISIPLQSTIYSSYISPFTAVSSNVTTWKLSGNNVVPDATYAWVTNYGTYRYVNYDFDIDGNNALYIKKDEIVSRTFAGQVSQEKAAIEKNKGLFLTTANYYGYQCNLPIATVTGAHYNECAFLTGDYHDNQIIDGTSYVDLEQKWVSGDATIAAPSIKHFSERTLVLQNGKFIKKKIAAANLNGNYIFTAWCLAAGTGTGHKVHLDALKGNSTEDISGSLATGTFDVLTNEWQMVKRVITADQIKSLASGSDLNIKITAETGTQLYIEDIRFYPANAYAKTFFYDPWWKLKTAEVNENNSCANITRYDGNGFAYCTAKRNTKGVETTIESISRHYMNCYPGQTSTLKEILVNNNKVKSTNGVFTYENTANTSKAKIVASAENISARVAINNDVSNDNVAARDVSINTGVNGPYVISVLDPDGNLSTPGTYKDYYLYINNSRPCLNTKGQNVADKFSNSVAFRMYGGLLTLIVAEPERIVFKQFTGGVWYEVFALPGSFSNVKAIEYNNILYFGALDNSNNSHLKIFQTSGTSPTDITYNISNASILDYAFTTNASGNLVTGIIADEAEELTGTASDEIVSKAFVKVLNGSQWDPLGTTVNGKVSETITNEICLGRNSSGIICSYSIEDDNLAGIAIKNFASGSWNNYAGGSVTNEVTSKHSMLIDQSGKVYVAYVAEGNFFDGTDIDQLKGVSALRVKKYQGGAWVDAETGKENICYVNDNNKYSFYLINDIPYLYFTNESNQNAVSIINLASTAWKPVGNYTTLNMGNNVQSFHDDAPYSKFILYQNENSGELDVIEDVGTCNNVYLENLQVNQNGINVPFYPGFCSYIYNYTVKVNSAYPTLNISGLANGSNLVFIDGEQVTSKSVYIEGSQKEIRVDVKSPDNSVVTTYILNVIKGKSSFVSLCGFNVVDNNGTALNYLPAFSPSVHNYTVSSLSAVQGLVRIKPVTNGNYTTMVNNHKTPGNYFSTPVGLEYGSNQVILGVYAEDNTTKSEYVIEFNRAAPSDVKLNSLTLSGLTLNKTFNNNDFSYNATASNSQQSFTINGSTTGQNIEYWYDDNVNGLLLSTQNSGPITINEGVSFLKLKVNGAGTEASNYCIKIQKEPANDVKLSAIDVFDQSNNRIGINSFNSAVTEYSIEVPNTVTSVRVAPQKALSSTKLYYGEDEITTADITIGIDVGQNTLKFDLVSQDESKRSSYTIIIMRNQEIPVSVLSVSASALQGYENIVKKIPIRISRSYSQNSAETVTYQVTGGSATNGSDFTLTPATSVTLDVCEEYKDIDLNIIDDAAVESDETVTITFYNSSSTVIGVVNYKILDDDKDIVPPTVTITSPTTSYNYWTSSSSINIAGTAQDIGGIASVRYTMSGATSGSGTATGTTNWTINSLTLNTGATNILVTATDNAGNVSCDVLKVTYGVETGIRYVRTNIGASGTGHSWEDPYKFLQDALNEARTSGGAITEIKVAAGTYYPDERTGAPVNGTDLRSESFILVNSVNLNGGYPEGGGDVADPDVNKTILNGDVDHEDENDNNRTNKLNTEHVVIGANCNIEGFIITGGKSDGVGAGFLSQNFTSNITKCVFLENEANDKGAGLYISFGSSTIRNCSFTSNKITGSASSMGAAIYSDRANVTIVSTTFESNNIVALANSEYEGMGGAIYVTNGTISITGPNTTFKNNNSAFGAAFYCEQTNNASIINATFFDNYSSENGGAIFMGIGTSSRIDRCVFVNNFATFGGAICYECLAASHSIINSIFLKNTANSNGGAIYYGNYARLSIIYSTFVNNNAIAGIGGGIYGAGYMTNTDIVNSIFWYNGPTTNIDNRDIYSNVYGALKVRYSDVQQNGFMSDRTLNNKQVEPKFYNATPAVFTDLRLLISDTDCRNYAIPVAETNVDINGTNRLTSPDMGAYECDGSY